MSGLFLARQRRAGLSPWQIALPEQVAITGPTYRITALHLAASLMPGHAWQWMARRGYVSKDVACELARLAGAVAKAGKFPQKSADLCSKRTNFAPSLSFPALGFFGNDRSRYFRARQERAELAGQITQLQEGLRDIDGQ